MAPSSPGPFPLVRLLALLAVVGMTALPFVSCGAIKFKGHELLRNAPPSEADIGLGKGLTKTTSSPDRKLFEDGDQWLWFTYLAAFVLAVVALATGGRGGSSRLLGLAGLAAVIAFLVGFNNLLGSQGSSSKGDEMIPVELKPGITLEIGAYLTLLSFAGIAAERLLMRRRT
jgi:hypothetical protein